MKLLSTKLCQVACIAILLILLQCTLSYGQRVLVIGIDGCRSDVAELANTPNLDNLKANGVYSPHCLNDDITISGPGWSAILCGVWSDKHLVTGNDFGTTDYVNYPTFFSRIEEYDASLNTVSICHWSPINTAIIQGSADVELNVSSDAAVASEAINQLTNNDPDVMFLHFDEADGVGHSQGFSADVPNYVAIIETIDGLIGDVMTALNNRPNSVDENWAILVTSDHGGINFSHGGNTFEEENVLFIASGDAIASQLVVRDSMLMDGATNCLDDSIELVFDGDNDQVSFPNISDYNFGANQDFTIECRVKTSVNADVSIIGNKDWDSGVNKGFVFSFKYPSGPEWKVNVGDGSNRVDLNVGGAIADGEWHTLSVSFDRDGDLMMYEDGVFLAQTSMTSIGDIDNLQDIFLGTDINNAYDFNGSIAEVRLWNTVIDALAISDYACTRVDDSHPNSANLIGYWKVNTDGSLMLQDYSTNQNNGIITGAEWVDPESLYTYDYSNIPRITDIPLSVYGHLCLPVDPAWSLDGRSWISDCTFGEAECVNPGSLNEWVGPSFGMWNIASNWSQSRVPILCDNVLITPGNIVTLQSGQYGECYTLDIKAGAELIVELGSELNVKID